MPYFTKKERAEAIAELQKLLPVGSTVYTCLRNVSRSGMTRRLTIHISEDGSIRDVTWLVARAADYRLKDGELIVGGCGMDMGFAVVYALGRYLYPDGFPVKGRGRNGDMSGWDKDGGYSLNHRWL